MYFSVQFKHVGTGLHKWGGGFELFMLDGEYGNELDSVA